MLNEIQIEPLAECFCGMEITCLIIYVYIYTRRNELGDSDFYMNFIASMWICRYFHPNIEMFYRCFLPKTGAICRPYNVILAIEVSI